MKSIVRGDTHRTRFAGHVRQALRIIAGNESTIPGEPDVLTVARTGPKELAVTLTDDKLHPAGPPKPDAALRVTDDGKAQRYVQAGEWLVSFHSASPDEPEVERWLAWCEQDARNLAAFEELYRDWNDLEGLRAAPELIPPSDRHVLGPMRGIV